MVERGLSAALAEWAALLRRSEFWLAALVLIVVGGGAGVVRALAMPTAASGSMAKFGLISIVFGVAWTLVVAACQFLLARRLGGDNENDVASAIGKWAALTILCALAAALAGFVTRLFVFRFTLTPLGVLLSTSFITLVLRLALLPVAVRQVSAAHSGDRYRLRDVTAFLGADPFAWYGVLTLISLGVSMALWAMGNILSLPGTNGALLLVGLLSGLAQALVLTFPIAAYRTLDRSRRGEANVFS